MKVSRIEWKPTKGLRILRTSKAKNVRLVLWVCVKYKTKIDFQLLFTFAEKLVKKSYARNKIIILSRRILATSIFNF